MDRGDRDRLVEALAALASSLLIRRSIQKRGKKKNYPEWAVDLLVAVATATLAQQTRQQMMIAELRRIRKALEIKGARG
jgi:hypothetical protein